MRRAAAGLTLIELLVAIAIFGVLSAVTYRALNAVLDSRDRIEQENRRWRELSLLFARLEQDIAAAAPRPVRDGASRPLPAFVGTAAGGSPAEDLIQFTRTGLAADPDSPAPPRRLGYRVRDGAIELLAWNVLDRAPRSAPTVTPVLRNVQSMQVRYLGPRGEWVAAWPQSGSGVDPLTALPAGVEVAITLASGERVTRLFATAARGPQ